MGRFWKHRSDKQWVQGHTGWYYSIEYYGLRHIYIDIEQLRNEGEEIAERKLRPISYLYPIWSKIGFELRIHNLRERFIHFLHRNEIVRLYDQAYEQFYSEFNNKE